MAGATRIPRADSKFSAYINNTADYLLEGTPVNGERLGLSADEITG